MYELNNRQDTINVLGMGNLLRADEGLGVVAVQRLGERYALPSNVHLIDGGTLGLDLICYFEDAARVLILDAILTEGGAGTLLRLADHEVPSFFGMRTSPHEFALPDLVALTELRGTRPDELVVLGLQPETIELHWGLSPAVEAHLDELLGAAVQQLRTWGVAVREKTAEERAAERALLEEMGAINA